MAQELWRLLGFAHQPDDAVAFTQADVQALEYTHDLVKLGILSPDRQAALVRTWGRSFARLAEWQTRLLTDVALESPDPVQQVTDLAVRGAAAGRGAAGLRLAPPPGQRRRPADGQRLGRVGHLELAVVFVDIVGFTSRSKELDETELVEWLEYFEAECSGLVVDHGGRVIKNIGDEVLFVADDVAQAADAALDHDRARLGRRRQVPGGARRAWRTATWSPASATSSGPPSTSPPGSPRSPGPARCSSTRARTTR